MPFRISMSPKNLRGDSVLNRGDFRGLWEFRLSVRPVPAVSTAVVEDAF